MGRGRVPAVQVRRPAPRLLMHDPSSCTSAMSWSCRPSRAGTPTCTARPRPRCRAAVFVRTGAGPHEDGPRVHADPRDEAPLGQHQGGASQHRGTRVERGRSPVPERPRRVGDTGLDKPQKATAPPPGPSPAPERPKGPRQPATRCCRPAAHAERPRSSRPAAPLGLAAPLAAPLGAVMRRRWGFQAPSGAAALRRCGAAAPRGARSLCRPSAPQSPISCTSPRIALYPRRMRAQAPPAPPAPPSSVCRRACRVLQRLPLQALRRRGRLLGMTALLLGKAGGQDARLRRPSAVDTRSDIRPLGRPARPEPLFTGLSRRPRPRRRAWAPASRRRSRRAGGQEWAMCEWTGGTSGGGAGGWVGGWVGRGGRGGMAHLAPRVRTA